MSKTDEQRWATSPELKGDTRAQNKLGTKSWMKLNGCGGLEHNKREQEKTLMMCKEESSLVLGTCK